MIYEDEVCIGDTIEVNGYKYTVKWVFSGNNGLTNIELSCGNNLTATYTLGWLNSNGAVHTKQAVSSWENAWIGWDYDPYYLDSDSSSSKSETKEEKCRHEWKEEVYFTSRIFKTCSKCGVKWEDENGE